MLSTNSSSTGWASVPAEIVSVVTRFLSNDLIVPESVRIWVKSGLDHDGSRVFTRLRVEMSASLWSRQIDPAGRVVDEGVVT